MTTTRILRAALLVALAASPAHAAVSVTLSASPSSTQTAGTPVALQAASTFTGTGPAVYQFAYRPAGGAWTILRDFYTWDRFDWVSLIEGAYELRVVARVPSTGESAEVVRTYTLVSQGRASPSVRATAHPLVAIYSAPPCSSGWMRVLFRPLAGGPWQFTPFQGCDPARALNFYVAGLRADSTYVVLHQNVLSATSIVYGPPLAFHSGMPAGPFNTMTVTLPPQPGASVNDTTILHSFIGTTNWFPVATDLSGAITWYYSQPMTSALRPVAGGNVLVLVRDDVTGRVLREIDLAGNTVRETNTTIVSQQLMAMGQDPVGVFHHEATRLPNGHTLALASVERVLNDVQGPGPVDVIGDMVLDLDENLQVAWAWNALDRLDASRQAVLGETCTSEAPGCPALFLAATANDWLHSNAIGYVPEDHNLIVSMRHQDWVIKIDYRDGLGTGAVLWRLGAGGDFTLVADPSQGPWPWFSHQHDAKMGRGTVLLFDNGNTRVEGPGGIGGNSRGQAWRVDEAAKTATLVFNTDLGGYSSALGSAQKLSNGDLHFGSGYLRDQPTPRSEGIEVALDGTRKYTIEANAFVYRSLRMKDIYRP